MAESAFAAHVDAAVHAAHPDYIALIVVASGIANGPSDPASDEQLAAAEGHLRASGLERATDHPHIAAWRAAFSAFGAKPSRYPSSAEALIARVLKGQPLPRVNALVDLYNAVSVRHIVPVGGEDADRLEGPLRLTVAAGDEPFDPPGDGSAVEPVSAGEIVWRDDRGVTCRRWNWRQGRRTQLTDDTTRAFFVFDRLEGLTVDELDAAAAQLSGLLRDRWPECRLERLERRGIKPTPIPSTR
ncbi:MAG TPA: phenylalanine--tRNA ligase beta subunit-related protein [Solirubrobacteraceae bacterium]|nr:phenylalanine--tRNA ligase beta subunit-related protein [Solirubrobacteraceae bacterium]